MPAESPPEALPAEIGPANRSADHPSVPANGSIGPIAIDLGHILARGQVIRREFRVKNPGSRPLRLIRADASVPCCSVVESLPPVLPPSGGEVAVVVAYRPNFNEGAKRLRLSITTDSSAIPTIELVLTATLHSSWSFRPVAGSKPIAVGEVGRLRFRVISGTAAGEDRGTPDVSLEAANSARIVPHASPIERWSDSGFVATSREIEVETAATTATGLHRGALAFRWPDGRVVREEIMWVVEPAVTVVPSGPILPPSPGPTTQTLVLRSADRPVRVLDVSGPMIIGPIALPAEAKPVHRLVLKLASSAVAAGGASTARILTDHPAQPEILIGVLTLQVTRGGAP